VKGSQAFVTRAAAYHKPAENSDSKMHLAYKFTTCAVATLVTLLLLHHEISYTSSAFLIVGFQNCHRSSNPEIVVEHGFSDFVLKREAGPAPAIRPNFFVDTVLYIHNAIQRIFC
jgi:hypothetical protein